MKQIPRKEIERDYRIERDPNPNLRLFECDFREVEDDNEWN